MTDNELKQQFMVSLAARLFADLSCPPLPPEEVGGAILESTGLELKVPLIEVAQHLGAIKWFLEGLEYSHNRREDLKAEQEAVAEVKKLLAPLQRKLKALSDPKTPLGRAVSMGAFILALEEGRLPPPKFPQIDESNARDLFVAEMAAHKERFERLRQQETERLQSAIRTLLDSLEHYDRNTETPSSPDYSRAYLNRVYVGEVLPALYQYYFGRAFGITRDPRTNKLRGAGIGFLRSAAKAIGVVTSHGEPYSDQRLISYWQEAKRNPWIDIPALREGASEANNGNPPG